MHKTQQNTCEFLFLAMGKQNICIGDVSDVIPLLVNMMAQIEYMLKFLVVMWVPLVHEYKEPVSGRRELEA